MTAKVWHDDVNDDAAAILPNPMIEPLPGTNHFTTVPGTRLWIAGASGTTQFCTHDRVNFTGAELFIRLCVKY